MFTHIQYVLIFPGILFCINIKLIKRVECIVVVIAHGFIFMLYRFKEMRFNPERAHQFKLENFVFFFRQDNFIYACRNVPKIMKTSDTIFIRTPTPLNFHC